MEALLDHKDEINEQLARYGVKFGIYKNGTFHERLFPFDPIPRQIAADEFKELEKGLVQRVSALNHFLYDIYHEKKIIRDRVVPEEFVYRSPGYLALCEGMTPPKACYSHISGIDLVLGKDGEWYVLEDNLRIPSGASYPLIARALCRRCSPGTFQRNSVVDNRNYGALLKRTMDYVNTGGINVIFTPGRYNAAYFEHSYLAEQSGAVLAESSELFVENRKLYYRISRGVAQVGALYRRVSDEYLDPLFFEPSSLIGIPNLMDVYFAGNVALVNAPGNGVADDKGIYYFVPKMVSYYLEEDPILKNAPTYLPYFESDLSYTMEHIGKLVIKDVAEAGGYGVVFGEKLSKAQCEDLKAAIRSAPRRFIAQEVIDFQDMPISEGSETVRRKADLRAFVLTGASPVVWPSGLTRFSRNPDSFIVNSSQGGGFKDTWIACQQERPIS
ncbi:MAG: circularly permuted type 2 ATP-grasp protein [Selenomonadaceae bacterium]|nr:circularly permuted type 2 ATP-grasp protein [Selenomonadaceae bacterium]